MIPLGDDNPVRRPSPVTWAILAACVAVFLWERGLGEAGLRRAFYSYGLVPAVLTGEARLPAGVGLDPAWLAVLTSMFLHGGWGHLLGNMLYLAIFGNNVEDRMGRPGFALFYLGCGAVAGLAQAAADPASAVPVVGASGAISGVLGAYLVTFPRAQVLVFVPLSFFLIHRVPAVWMLGLWFALQVVSAAFAPAQGGGGGVAWLAHVGGFVAGAAIAWALRGRLRLPPPPTRAAPAPAAAPRRGPWG